MFRRKVTDELRNWIEKKLKNLNLADIQINIISPKYENLTTILNEYQEEQADFDLLLYFALTLVALLFAEWWLQSREQF